MALAVMVLAAVLSLSATADDVESYEEIAQHLRAAQEIAPLTDGAFGDHINLYNGATEFDVTDIAIPGNNALPVQVGRRFVIENRPWMQGNLGGFGEWDLDIPYVEAMVTSEKGWVLNGSTPNSRCSDNTDVLNTYVSATTPAAAPIRDIYDGTQLHIPGDGQQELLANTQSKSPAYASRGTYKWVTTNQWRVSCVSATANGYPGEGFVAVSPAGVSYTFNWAVVNAAMDVDIGTGISGGKVYVGRVRVFLLVTHVQDRFGNTVDYHYDSSNHLTSIAASDGRSIALTWSGNNIATATAPVLGTWTYGYGTYSDGKTETYTTLNTVTRPDSSRWIYTNAAGTYLANQLSGECGPFCPGDGLKPPPIHCQSDPGFTPYAKLGEFSYSITGPSGATATYHFEYDRHYRSGVPESCAGDGNPNHQYPYDFSFFDGFSILTKQVTGPGLPSMTWTYDTGGVYAEDSGQAPGYFSASVPYDPSTQVYIPGGGTCSNTHSGSYSTTVTGPVSVTLYDFGSDFGCDEGRLYGSEVKDLQGHILKTTFSDFINDQNVPSQPFPTIAGSTLLGNDAHPSGNRVRPVIQTVIMQDGASFTTSVNSFDDFARAISSTESSSNLINLGSSVGYRKTDTITYQDDLSRWVLGQVSSTSVLGAAVPCTASTASDADLSTCTLYDSNTDLPTQDYRFGKLVSTKAWHPADGTDQAATLASVEDGDGNTMTLSGWYRGLPQSVGFADGTTQAATVNGAGWITATVDETGATTSYQYDAMGRLKEIDYPPDSVNTWNATKLSFGPVGTGQYGTATGSWVQTVQTGNAVTNIYFDAFWRPLVTEHYDAGNQGGTLSQVVTKYDAGGRKIFTSYPTNSATSYTQSLAGTHTTYDALNRVTGVAQDSELGSLPTTTAYLSGFETQVTDPRGYATLTSYQAYGEPTTQWPVSISAPQGQPQGQLTTIQRDVFGKPSSITRTGTASGSPSLTRYYIYDGYQQLCKRIEPESGATAFGYDGAGNLAWSASGLDMPDGNCDASAAESSGRVVGRTYDKRNRLYTVTYPDGSSDATFVYYPDGALQTQTVRNGGGPITTNYYYDKRRLLTSETLSLPNTSPFTLTYGYDANGHLSSTTYPDGRTIGYAPNALGQPTAAGTYAGGVTYHPSGAIASFTYGNGLVHTMTENERGLVDRSTDSYGGTPVHDDTYAYDGDANVAAITDGTSGNVGNRDMTYDALDRLTEADSPMFQGSGKAQYTYDALDNLLSASVGGYSNVAYAYNADSQLVGLVEPGTVYNLHTYTYDAQGNLANKDGQTYQFDMANRLRSVPGVGNYLYDAAGRRVQKDETLYGGILLDADYSKAGQLMYQWQPATQSATDYIYLGGTLVARVVNVPTPPPNVPAAPASITVTPTSDSTGTFSVSWPASAGASSYVLWQNANGGGADSVYSGSSTSDSITGLASGRYVYQVQACNSSGCSGFATSGAATVIPAPPASITVPAYNFSTTIPVSWAASSLANNYVLEEYPYSGGWGVAYEGGNTSYTATVPGSGTYQFQVAACGAGGCSGYSTSGNVIVTLPPSLSASTTSSISGTFTLSWNAVPTATGYTLLQNGAQVYTGSATSWSSNNLGNGSYTYTVQSCNASGCGGASNAVTVAVNHIAAPSLSASTGNSTSGTFTMSWNTVADATSYQLYQGGTLVYNSTGTSWSSNNLPNGTYTYTVYGCNGSTCGFASPPVTVTVLHVPPAPTLSANESSSSNGSFTLSWNTTTGASSYNLYQNGTSVYNSTGTSWSASGLGNGTYTYTVNACNTSGCSASNAVTVTVLLLPPSSHLSASSVSSTTGTFTLSWTSAIHSTRYQLNQSLNGGSATAVYNSTGLSFTTNMLGSGTYTYVVYACDQTLCASASNSVQVIVSPIPIAPASMSAPSSVTQGVGFAVSWTAVTGATSYTVRWTNIETGRVMTSTSSTASAEVTISLPDDYQLAVQACDAKGCSAWTNAGVLTTVNSSKNNAVPAVGGSS